MKINCSEWVYEWRTGYFQKSCNANALNKSEYDAIIIRENTKQQSLICYANVLTEQIQF